MFRLFKACLKGDCGFDDEVREPIIKQSSSPNFFERRAATKKAAKVERLKEKSQKSIKAAKEKYGSSLPSSKPPKQTLLEKFSALFKEEPVPVQIVPPEPTPEEIVAHQTKLEEAKIIKAKSRKSRA